MKNNNSNTDEIDFLNKIISYDKDLFFQFTKHVAGNISCDYLSESVQHFYELSALEIKINPNIILEERNHFDDQKGFTHSLNYAIKNLAFWEFEYRIALPKRGLIWVKVKANIETLYSGDVNVLGKLPI